MNKKKIAAAFRKDHVRESGMTQKANTKPNDAKARAEPLIEPKRWPICDVMRHPANMSAGPHKNQDRPGARDPHVVAPSAIAKP